MSRRSIALLGWLLIRAAGPAGAQTARPVHLLGRIADIQAGAPVVLAEVVLPGPDLVARTGQDGSFRFPPLPGGTYLVLVRSVGYVPWTGVLNLGAADTARVTVLLQPARAIGPLAERLPDLEVRGRTAVSARMAGYEARRVRGQGYFVDRDLLERRESSRVSDVLRQVPGVSIVETGRVSQAIVVSRQMLGGQGPNCYARIFLDGHRIFDPVSSRSAAGVDGPPNLDAWSVRELEAIEIYRSVPETPVEFLEPGAECGTVLIWTRAPSSPGR